MLTTSTTRAIARTSMMIAWVAVAATATLAAGRLGVDAAGRGDAAVNRRLRLV